MSQTMALAWRLAGAGPVRSGASALLLRAARRNHAAAHHISPNPLDKLAEEESYIIEAVRSYAENEIKPKIGEMDAKGALDTEVRDGLFAQGFMGVTVDHAHGGTGSSFTAAALVCEELARQDPGVSAVCELHNVLCNVTLQQHGSPEQRAEFLPALVSDTLAAAVKHDPDVVGSVPLTAKLDQGDDSFIINGKRAWCTQARAGLLLVFADSSLFLIDSNQPGVHMHTPPPRLGLRALEATLVDFSDVRVSAKRIVGTRGAGDAIWAEAKARAAISGSALCVGLARGVYDSAMPYLYQRSQFGTPIANFQSMQHQRAQVATEIEAARLLTLNAARLVDHGAEYAPAARLALNFAMRTAAKASSLSIEWLGGVGFTTDFPAEKFYRDCKLNNRFPLLMANAQ